MVYLQLPHRHHHAGPHLAVAALPLPGLQVSVYFKDVYCTVWTYVMHLIITDSRENPVEVELHCGCMFNTHTECAWLFCVCSASGKRARGVRNAKPGERCCRRRGSMRSTPNWDPSGVCMCFYVCLVYLLELYRLNWMSLRLVCCI